jgi:hypothetical protein
MEACEPVQVTDQQEQHKKVKETETETMVELVSAAATVVAAASRDASISTSSDASSDSDVRSWTEQQVAAWLAGIGTTSAYAKYGDAFESGGVNGELLLDGIEEEELVDLGVTSRLHRRRIMQDVAKLRAGGRPCCLR